MVVNFFKLANVTYIRQHSDRRIKIVHNPKPKEPGGGGGEGKRDGTVLLHDL